MSLAAFLLIAAIIGFGALAGNNIPQTPVAGAPAAVTLAEK